MNAYNNFTNRTYHAVVDTSNNDNMSYAAVGLYSLMNEMYGSISREELKNDFDNLLGLNENSRKKFYEYVMLANSFVSENCTTQLKNSAFFNTEFNYSQEFVNKLTDLYCQAYTIDFKTEADKMVEWVNKAVNSDGFIDKSFLKMSQYTQLYFFSTLYFKNAWAHKYLSENNVDDEFYLSNGSTITTKYMSHSYTTDCYYDYGSYISFKDYYLTGVGSITYLIPKDTSDDIYALTRNVNIFDEKDTNKVVFKRDPYSDYTSPFVVNLKTPKFKVTAEIDFKNSLSNLGFGDMFDDHFDSFHNAFDDPAASTLNFYLEQAKQKNEVEFNEDGTTNKDGKARRSQAKSILLGVLYGRGKESIADQLGTTIKKAEEIKESVFRGFPAIRKFEQDSIYMAQTRGFVTTVCGRKRRLPSMMKPDYEFKWKDGVPHDDDVLNFDAELSDEVPEDRQIFYLKKLAHCKLYEKRKVFEQANEEGIWIIDNTRDKDTTKVVNARIQGSAADLTKLAMIKLHNSDRLKELGFRLLIPVHDELIAECPEENVKECSHLLAQIMSEAAEDILKMPIKCDVEVTKCWYGEPIEI